MNNSEGQRYVDSIRSIEEAIKRMNLQVKSLRLQKKEKELRLYNWMIKNNIDQIGGIKRSKIEPKEKSERKKEADKKREAIELFETLGIENTEEAYLKFKLTQKSIKPKIEESDEEDFGAVKYV